MKPAPSRTSLALAALAGVLSIVLRIVPHPANFTSVGALGLFGGAKLRPWQALGLPLLVLFVSDFGLFVFTGFDPRYSPLHVSRTFVYASFLVYVAIGRFLQQRESWGWIIGASLAGSLQFFFITNLGEWLTQPLISEEILPSAYRYSRDLSGLAACFAAAVPFFRTDFPWDLHAFVMLGDPRYGVLGTILGDLVCTCAVFGASKVLEGVKAGEPAPDAGRDSLKTAHA